MNFKAFEQNVLLRSVHYFRLALVKYFQFAGRSHRGEFWWFTLAIIFISLVLDAIEGFATGRSMFDLEVYLLSSTWSVFLAVPQLAISARRLHDVGRSGWWQLIGLTIIGIIPLVYWFVQKGQAEDNIYGSPSDA